MKTLLKNPAAIPTTRPNRMASGSGSPAAKVKPTATETSARFDPTERSMPPVMMIRVIPSAMRPTSTK